MLIFVESRVFFRVFFFSRRVPRGGATADCDVRGLAQRSPSPLGRAACCLQLGLAETAQETQAVCSVHMGSCRLAERVRLREHSSQNAETPGRCSLSALKSFTLTAAPAGRTATGARTTLYALGAAPPPRTGRSQHATVRCSAVGCAWASPHARRRRRCLASRAVTPAAPYVRFCARWLRARHQHGMCWDVTSLSVRVATPSLGQPRIDRTANGALVDSMITTRRPAYARGCFRLCPRRPRRLRRLDGLCMCGC